jgi:hypothetical protein
MPGEFARLRCARKCQYLESKVEHYRKMSKWVTDKITLEGIEILIEKYQADKRALHPLER